VAAPRTARQKAAALPRSTRMATLPSLGRAVEGVLPGRAEASRRSVSAAGRPL
jgi:hypothetical protein